MSAIPAKEASGRVPEDALKRRFEELASRWLAETAHVSSSSELVAHPAFQEIVELGSPAIPLLLRELDKRSGHWHRALRRVAGVDPVPASDRGSFEKSAQAWLRWGREQGYRW
jgi:hypothetical protein